MLSVDILPSLKDGEDVKQRNPTNVEVIPRILWNFDVVYASSPNYYALNYHPCNTLVLYKHTKINKVDVYQYLHIKLNGLIKSAAKIDLYYIIQVYRKWAR
jgi:hypothetical protein